MTRYISLNVFKYAHKSFKL